MTPRFADVLRGLMDNRGLSPRAISYASARAESTIRQLLDGRIPPSPQIVSDIAPVLQVSEADLLIVAGLAGTLTTSASAPYRNSAEIGELVSIASSLSDERLRRLMDAARNLNSEDRN